MITVMTGQVVDFFDQDFRELYAISEKLDLYKEFHVSPPAVKTATLTRSRSESKRPPLPATTSRFQVSLGDSHNANIQVPAHKYYNPKYLLALGDIPRPTGSLQEPGPKRGSVLAEVIDDMDLKKPRQANSEKMGQLSPLPSEAPSDIFQNPNGVTQDKKKRSKLSKFFRGKPSNRLSVNSLTNSTCPTPTEINPNDDSEDSFEVIVRSPSKFSKKLPKLGRGSESKQSVESAQDNESK